ncbi:hypothetical protein GGE60_004925 [Rhizobium leucaenae]|uniref:Uncharacterized protein n=1 Tax=Rhizobium leucaenae TaxID=29450 RepID=A0A7W7EP11_9HYPH|nr:hypothetical protein [Rhizobium leucaenae]
MAAMIIELFREGVHDEHQLVALVGINDSHGAFQQINSRIDGTNWMGRHFRYWSGCSPTFRLANRPSKATRRWRRPCQRRVPGALRATFRGLANPHRSDRPSAFLACAAYVHTPSPAGRSRWALREHSQSGNRC